MKDPWWVLFTLQFLLLKTTFNFKLLWWFNRMFPAVLAPRILESSPPKQKHNHWPPTAPTGQREAAEVRGVLCDEGEWPWNFAEIFQDDSFYQADWTQERVGESVDVFSLFFWVFLKIDILKEDFGMWEMRKQFSTLDLCFRVWIVFVTF